MLLDMGMFHLLPGYTSYIYCMLYATFSVPNGPVGFTITFEIAHF